MKKIIMAAAILCTTVCVQAATVGWGGSVGTTYSGDKYLLFVINQAGCTSVDQITKMLNDGDAFADIAGKAFADGSVLAAGTTLKLASKSGKEITTTGTYTSFMVLFDSAAPVANSGKYAVLSGDLEQTKQIGVSTASITFNAGDRISYLSDSANWKAYGAAPEPTSGLLLLIGVAGLALRRRRA